MPFDKNIEKAYELGTLGQGGGIFGALIAIPATKLLGTTGSSIIISVIIFFLSIITYGGSPSKYVQAKLEENEKLRAERLKERELQQALEEKRRKEEEKNKNKRSNIPDGQLRINLDGEIIEVDNNEELENEKAEKESFLSRIFGKANTKDKEIVEEEQQEDVAELDRKNNEANLLNIKKNLQNAQRRPDGNVEEDKGNRLKDTLKQGHIETYDEEEKYEFPPISILNKGKSISASGSKKMVTDTASKIQKTLYSFGVSAKVADVSVGPAVTRYEIIPAVGVRVSKIANLTDDLALNLAAQSLRIEAPIPR